jgi:hypothetical protein
VGLVETPIHCHRAPALLTVSPWTAYVRQSGRFRASRVYPDGFRGGLLVHSKRRHQRLPDDQLLLLVLTAYGSTLVTALRARRKMFELLAGEPLRSSSQARSSEVQAHDELQGQGFRLAAETFVRRLPRGDVQESGDSLGVRSFALEGKLGIFEGSIHDGRFTALSCGTRFGLPCSKRYWQTDCSATATARSSTSAQTSA